MFLGREYDQLQKFLDRFSQFGEIHKLGAVSTNNKNFEIIGLTLGSKEPEAPSFGLFAGVHGLEKIGTHLAIYFLDSLIKQLVWDETLMQKLSRCRICSIPLINPAGMFLNKRSNANNVDLMRNAPQDASGKTLFLASGHFLSPKLPWYRGEPHKLETENQALVDFVQKNMFDSNFAFSLDLHSGFGMQDRLWFPYAKTSADIPHHRLANDFKDLIDTSIGNHVYKIEKQSDSYLLHGDMWDYIYDLHLQKHNLKKVFLPWTLEMGSWIWVKKSPFQILKKGGLYNPYKVHRYYRILRRHWRLLDTFFNAVKNHKNWVNNEHSAS